MRPEVDDTTIRMPITFDYNGGRGDKKRGNIISAIIIIILTIIFVVGIIRNDDLAVGQKVIFSGLVLLISMILIRFKILHELTYSDAYETLKEEDYTPGTQAFWGIYEIDSTYPYICHYKDGKHGIFIKMEKDVVVGKPDDVAYNHYEAISSAYQMAGSMNMNMCHIDYMDNVGNDPRLRKLYENLSECDNPDLKEMMISIYSNLQDEMSRDYASFDIYLFTSKGHLKQLEYNVKACVDCLLQGNYLTYKALDIEGIRATCMAVLNLSEFSALEACDNIFKASSFKGIIPIRVEHVDSIEELNKTQEQIRQENAERLQAELDAKEAKRNRRRRKGVKAVDNSEDGIVSDSSKGFVSEEATGDDMSVNGSPQGGQNTESSASSNDRVSSTEDSNTLLEDSDTSDLSDLFE